MPISPPRLTLRPAWGLLALLFALSPVQGSPPGTVCWEAERAFFIHPPLRVVQESKAALRHGAMRNGVISKASEGYLQMAWNKDHLNGKATYRFKVPYPGFYHVWMRAMWQDSASNRIDFQVNEGRPRTVGEDATYRFWHWVGGRRVRCHQGWNELVLQNMDMGVKIDQILLTPHPDFIPTGIR
jgi:hypothetical protein